MIKFIIFSLLIFSSNSFAGDVDGVCGLNSCTSKMESILNLYKEGNPISHVSDVYSGECYHRGRGYNSNDVHYGGILIDVKKDKKYFNGKFSFFTPDNPYRGLDVEAARTTFSAKYEISNEVKLKDYGHYTDFNSNKIPVWRYYFSESANSINMIGIWGVKHILFCQLAKH